jgi:hypothetical protein
MKLVRWTDEECLAVGTKALEYMHHSSDVIQAFKKAQREVLPRSRHRTERALQQARSPSASRSLDRLLAEARQETGAPKLQLSPGNIEPPDAPIKNEPGKVVRWSREELGLMAWAHDKMREQGDTRPMSSVIYDVQRHVLPLSRRRVKTSLHVACSKKDGGRPAMAMLLDQGRAFIKTLPPEQRPGYQPPAPPPEPVAVAAPEQAPQAPPTLLETSPATAPGTQRETRLSDAAKAFGDSVMAAIDVLLGAHETLLLSEMQHRLSRVADDVVSRLGGNIKDLVHQSISAELGGPIAVPAPPVAAPEPLPAPPPPDPPKPKHLTVDIIGLLGAQAETLRKTFNGDTTFNFIDASDREWQPRNAPIIMMTKFVSHRFENICRNAGAKPIRINGGVTAVVSAVDSLRKTAGLAPYHH